MLRDEELYKDYPHPLVLKYIDSFRDSEGYAYLVTEYAEEDLNKNMSKKFKLGQKYAELESANIIL